MKKKREWKPILTILLVIFSMLYVAPTIAGGDVFPETWKRLNYGLDLQGGLELRYTVDYKRAIGDNTWKAAGVLRDRLIQEKLGKQDDPELVTSEELTKYRAMVAMEQLDFKSVRLGFSGEMTTAIETVDDDFLEQWVDQKFMRGDSGSESDGSTYLVMQMKYDSMEEFKTDIISQTMEIIRKRINAFGLVEPDVRQAGESDIDVQLPGVDPDKMDLVRLMIGQTAQLMFRLIEQQGNPLQNVGNDLESFKAANANLSDPQQLPPNANKECSLILLNTTAYGSAQNYLFAYRKSDLLKFLRYIDEQRTARGEGPVLDEDHMFGFEEVSYEANDTERFPAALEQCTQDGVPPLTGWRTHYVIRNMKVGANTGQERAISISGDRLTRASVQVDERGAPYASMDFDGEGAKDFGDLTTEFEQGFLSIMLDDEVKSAPQIEEPITGGRARVTLGQATGQNAVKEAKALVDVLTQGAYKAPVHKVHDHFVGPSLGKASIDSGMKALLIGAILVVFFILFYYRVSGAIAIMALSLNVLFVIAILISFNAALTLPGIAGIVLTIGMAVDANVIIFERIREEVRAGKSIRAAVDTGYAKAFWTIFDANITTALAGFILLTYTTGPIYGFAVTLLAGIVSSMFTAIYVTRMVFNWQINTKKIETLSI